MTETEQVLSFSSIDPTGRVKFAVLLEMFQEMADIDASKYGLSVSQTLEHSMTWVLRKYRIDIEKYPTSSDKSVKIRTYAEPYRNLFSLRTFKMWNHQGEYLGSAYTWWVMVDTVKLRPVRLDKCELMSAFMTQMSDVLPSDVKIPEVSEPQTEEIWKVRWQDLDVNNHTNHAVYFGWALDTVPYEVPSSMSPMLVEGEFLHPIPRTKVRCLTEEIESSEGRSFLHSLRHIDDDTEYAKLSSHWK